MKKLLFILLLAPLFTLAQDTVKLPTPVARRVAKDLIKLDSTAAELELCKEENILLNQKIVSLHEILTAQTEKGSLYEERIKNEQSKFDAQKEWIEQLRKENKRLKTKLTLNQIGFTTIIGALTYFLIAK
jgi:hypothetical protein